MVTHSSTSRPVQCLCMAERTGCPVFTDLWSYVLERLVRNNIKLALWHRRLEVRAYKQWFIPSALVMGSCVLLFVLFGSSIFAALDVDTIHKSKTTSIKEQEANTACRRPLSIIHF